MPLSIRFLLALLCLITAAGMAWYIGKIRASGEAELRFDSGLDGPKLDRSREPKKFARYVLQLWFLIGLLGVLTVAILMLG